jgi:hypothetical protein
MTDNQKTSADSDRGEDLVPLIGGIAIGMALVAIAWVFVALGTGGSDEGHDAGGGGADGVLDQAGASISAGPIRPIEPSPLERCTDAAGDLEVPLAQVEGAMSQWQVHIGAMNKLVVGEITLGQATAFWNQTRVGAHRLIERFDRAAQRVEREGVDCPAPSLIGAGSSPRLRACSLQVAADVHELEVARTAVTTWRHHVHDMDRLRLGTLSPDDATRMWLSMWQRGVQELEDYRNAERAARRAPGCGVLAVVPAQPTPSESSTSSPGQPMESMGSMH